MIYQVWQLRTQVSHHRARRGGCGTRLAVERAGQDSQRVNAQLTSRYATTLTPAAGLPLTMTGGARWRAREALAGRWV